MTRRNPLRTNAAQINVRTPVRCGQLDEDWRTQGLCRQGHDPEIWYPHNPHDSWLGVAICKTCPVQRTCLEYSMAHRERHGTWGGLTEWQRDRMKLPLFVTRG